MAYTGDVPANMDMTVYGSIIKNTANGNFSSQIVGMKQFCVTIPSPANTMSIVFAYMYEGMTLVSLDAICAGGTSVGLTLYDQTTAYSGGSSVATLTATTAGDGTTFSTGISAGHVLNVTVGTVTGSVTTVTIIVTGCVT